MAFTPKNWIDDAPPAINAAGLEDLETRVTDYAESYADSVAGPGASLPFINVKDAPYDAQGDGVTDDTAAIQAAIDDGQGQDGGDVYIPAGTYIVSNLTIADPMTLRGPGKRGAHLKAKSGATGYMLTITSAGGQVPNASNRISGIIVRGIRFDGNDRLEDIGGINLQLLERFRMDDCQLRHFQREGLLLGRGIRESVFTDIYVRACGSLDAGYPGVGIIDSQNQQADNLTFYGCQFLGAWGTGLLIKRDTSGDEHGPTRNIWFIGGMLHNLTEDNTGSQNISDGYTDYGGGATEPIYTHEFGGGHCAEIQNARQVFFYGMRFNTSGRGQSQLYLSDEPGASDTINNVHVTDCCFGGSDYMEKPFIVTDLDANTILATDLDGPNYLATGAVFRVSSTTALPAGLAADTDYYAIRVDDNTLKLATSRANAVAGTAVDITGSGTGTHTLATRDLAIEIDAAAATNAVYVAGSVCETAQDGNDTILDSADGHSVVLLDNSEPRFTGPNAGSQSKAAAATWTLPDYAEVVTLTGSATVTSIVNEEPGRVVTIVAGATTADIADGNNISLNGDWVPAQGDTLTLACDGPNWYEVSRNPEYAGATVYHEDTQTANITATGVLTGISVTPAAGTYIATATAQAAEGATGATTALSLRVNGSNVVTGPQVGGAASARNTGAVVHGLITPTGSQAVEVYAAISGTVTVSIGRLVLLKVA